MFIISLLFFVRVDQLVYLPKMQIQMLDVAFNHIPQCYSVTFVVSPVILELCFIYRTDYLADVNMLTCSICKTTVLPSMRILSMRTGCEA